MKYIFLIVIILILKERVIAQIDTLKFVDGTIMVMDGNKIIHSSLNTGAFRIVEQSAEFPGGRDSFYKWLGENMKPDSTLENNVVVKAVFTINTKGLPIAVVAEGDTTNGRGKKVISLIQKMPRWKPAAQQGTAVRMRLSLPITFSKVEKAKK